MEPLEAAYVLVARPYSNTSLMVELITPNHGRIGAIAKGARRQAGKGGGHLQPFIPLDVLWRGRGEVKTLTKAEAHGAALLSEGKLLYCGFYLNELIMRLTEREDPHPPVFQSYSKALIGLAQCDDPEPLLRQFECALLEALGYGLCLTHTKEGEPVEAEGVYSYTIESGLAIATSQGKAVLQGETLLAMTGDRPYQAESLRQSRAFMRSVLGHYLGSKPLKSRELFRTLYPGPSRVP